MKQSQLEKISAAERGQKAMAQVTKVLKEHKNWCRWFAGFCDGEGSFTMQNKGRDCYVPRFKLCLRGDAKLITKIAGRFKFGWSNPAFPMAALQATKDGQRYIKNTQSEWDVYHTGECLALVRLFSHPACRLGSDRQFSFKLWSKFVRVAISPTALPSTLNALALHLSVNTANKGGSQIARTWLRYYLSREPSVQMEALGLTPPPKTLAEAHLFAEREPHQFCGWALALVKAPPAKREKGGREAGKEKAVKAFNGLKGFRDLGEKGDRKIGVSVKGCGNVDLAMVKEFIATIKRTKVEIGIFLTLTEPTKAMSTEAVAAGFYESASGKKYPRLQILTIESLLAGTACPEHP